MVFNMKMETSALFPPLTKHIAIEKGYSKIHLLFSECLFHSSGIDFIDTGPLLVEE